MLYVLVKFDEVTSLLSNAMQITFRLYSFCHELRLFVLQSELTIYIYVTYITCRESKKPPHSECQQVAISSLGWWLSENVCLQKSPAWCTLAIYCHMAYVVLFEIMLLSINKDFCLLVKYNFCL